MTLRETYEIQLRLERERWNVSEAINDAWHDQARGAMDYAKAKEHPTVKAAQAIVDRLAAEERDAQKAVGGRVFRVANRKLDALRERITKLNRRAEKLGCEAIELAVSTEQEQTKRMVVTDHESFAAIGAFEGINCHEEIVDYVFVTVDGSAPMLPGFVFVATLDHETGDEDRTGIRRVPVNTFLRTKIGEEAADAIEALDLTEFATAKAWCVHCNTTRRRNQTYLVWNVEEGELRQVGSDCLRDYTGANNPERIARWAEYLEALSRDLGMSRGDDGFGDIEVGGGRRAIATRDFLATVSAVTAKWGWVSRWTRATDYEDSYRNEHATADVAMRELLAAKPAVSAADEDYTAADEALAWVRDELGEQDDLDEFQTNLVTYTAGDFLGEKGDGFVAYTIEAHKRELERRLAAEKAAGSEWIGEIKQRIKGLTFTVTFTRNFESAYGTRTLTKGYTPDGDGIVWWGAGGLAQGKTYRCAATVKKHEIDDYNGGGKVTQITNVRSAEEVE